MPQPPPPMSERRLDYVALDEIAPALRNPKGHDPSMIAGSINAFGFVEPMVLDERTGRLVAGHGRLDDLTSRRERGEEPPDGIVVADDGRWHAPVIRGWASRSDDEAHAAGIALNHTTMAGGWEMADLAALLDDLQGTDVGLAPTGFTDDDLAGLLADLDAADLDEAGDLLALADVTIGEPTHQVEPGQVWALGAHRLVVADVMVGHAVWAPLLEPGTVFLPYPGPFVAFVERRDEARLVMVQPDPFIAGHVLDKWAAIHGEPERLS